MADDDLVQTAERALFEAEQAYRSDPSEANRRRIREAWRWVREVRREPPDDADGPGAPFIDPRRPAG